MTGLIDWAAARARMILAFIALSLVAGGFAYSQLPKEGEPDIEIPAIFVSVPFPGISAEDAETLLVKPMETELSDIDGLKEMSATAAEGYAGVALEFEFGWDKSRTLADVRAAMNTAEAQFPDGAENYSINEINFSEFPIIIVSLTGEVPERTLLQLGRNLQTRIETLEPVLEAPLAGHRDEMVEVVIDPVRLESYGLTASDLTRTVVNNNQLIAAGELDLASGAFAVKIPSSFGDSADIRDLPIKTNEDRVVTLSDVADIRLTFEDATGTARFDGHPTVALQVVKRKGFNLIDTAALVRDEVARERATWPEDLQRAVSVSTSNDQSRVVEGMVSQLEGSVLTAVALVMIVVLAALGPRSALLVGFAIPTSFLLCFAFLAVMGVSISNIVMFGLILAVGMLVDGAIVVVESAERRMSEGEGPMRAFVGAAKRMFWPIVSSTATTLCAFLPMLFWPGVPGEFMGMLPVTLIFVLSASLVVALIYLPVMGGVSGRLTRALGRASAALEVRSLGLRAGCAALALGLAFAGAASLLNPALLPFPAAEGMAAALPGAALFILGAMAVSVTISALFPHRKTARPLPAAPGRTLFGRLIALIARNAVMPLVVIGAVVAFVVGVFATFGANNNGVEFFVETEPEQAIVYVRARGNLSLTEKDALVRQVEETVLGIEGVDSAFAFAGEGGLNSGNPGVGEGPRDTIGQVQFEIVPWEDRPRVPAEDGWRAAILREVVDPYFSGDAVIARMQAALDEIPGIYAEITDLAQGPAQGKPVHLRLTGDDFGALTDAAGTVRDKLASTRGIENIEDTLPLPGIDWQIDVDVAEAGRYGADVATVGAMVQLVTRGITLDTMRVDTSDEEIDIRVRLPEEDRLLSTLDTLRVRTEAGLVPLANFVSVTPVEKLAQIDRVDQTRYYDVKADVATGLTRDDGTPINATERIAVLTDWLETEAPLPPGVGWSWEGDQAEQAESQAFLSQAFVAALGLMFIILLAQFNSFYNAVLVLLAVILSTTGVLIGMLVMNQPFSIIMTGTGVVALAGIVVNNNIVLIDTYQELCRTMPRKEAIIRTAELRLRPVLLTSLTTMAGLTPMMFGLSLDFFGGGATLDSPTALWWKQLATAVVFGLGTATILTLVFTPSMLALRVWVETYALALGRALARLSGGRSSRAAQDWVLRRRARQAGPTEIVWETDPADRDRPAVPPLRAAE